jgi:hypothetical protein
MVIPLHALTVAGVDRVNTGTTGDALSTSDTFELSEVDHLAQSAVAMASGHLDRITLALKVNKSPTTELDTVEGYTSTSASVFHRHVHRVDDWNANIELQGNVLM